MATQADLDALDTQMADLKAQRLVVEAELTATEAAVSLKQVQDTLAAEAGAAPLVALGMTLAQSTGHPQWVEVHFPLDENIGKEILKMKQMGGESLANRPAGKLTIHRDVLIAHLKAYGTAV